MLKDEQKFALKSFFIGKYIFALIPTEFSKSEESKSDSDWVELSEHIGLCPYLELICCPA